jgi:hypothetical protein
MLKKCSGTEERPCSAMYAPTGNHSLHCPDCAIIAKKIVSKQSSKRNRDKMKEMKRHATVSKASTESALYNSSSTEGKVHDNLLLHKLFPCTFI